MMRRLPRLSRCAGSVFVLTCAWGLSSGCSDAQDDADTLRYYLDSAPEFDVVAGPGDGQGSTGDNGRGGTAAAGVVLNEVAAKGDPEDWVELFNRGVNEVDLSGWTLSDAEGGTYTVPNGTSLAPGAFLSVERTTDFEFGLGGTDGLTLTGPNGVEDKVSWEEGDSPDGESYARIPNGTGVFQRTATPTRDAVNVGTDADEGTDGTDGSDDPGMVVINEVAASGAPADWFELHNTGTIPRDISGWKVADDKPEEFVFPVGTVIPAGGYLSFERTARFSFTFGLGGADALTLWDASGAQVDSTNWSEGDSPVGASWARIPDATGEFARTYSPTRDAANAQKAEP